MFQGSFVALVTPFTKDGKIDEKKLTELVDWQISEGTQGIVPVGTTGESAALDWEEHMRVVDVVVKAVKKRVPVIAGTGSNSTEEAIALSKDAEEMGVDGVLSVNPYYNKPSQDGLIAHFGAIADSIKIPLVLYNIPSRTAVNLDPASVEKLVKKHKNIVAVKDATGSVHQPTDIISRLGTGFDVLSGDDFLTLPLIAIGGKGVISVAANIIPKDISRMCKLAQDGKIAEAREIHLRLYALVKALFIETNPSPVKAAMKELGLLQTDTVRLPMVPVKADSLEKIRAALKKFGVKSPVVVK